jgi:hypothetical protein
MSIGTIHIGGQRQTGKQGILIEQFAATSAVNVGDEEFLTLFLWVYNRIMAKYPATKCV